MGFLKITGINWILYLFDEKKYENSVVEKKIVKIQRFYIIRPLTALIWQEKLWKFCIWKIRENAVFLRF